MKKIVLKKLKITTLCVLIFTVMLCSACQNTATFKKQVIFDFLGTSVLVGIKTQNSFWQNSDKKLDECFSEIENALKSIDDKFSTQKPDSVVSNFNNATGGEIIACDDEFLKVYQISNDIYLKSGGLFNPLIKNLVDLWAFSKRYKDNDYSPRYNFDRERLSGGAFSPPNDEYALAFKLLLCVENNTVTNTQIIKSQDFVTVDNVNYYQSLDFSGMLKGYATDIIKGIIDKYGFTDYYFSIGSSSMYLSTDGGSDFYLELTDPDNTALSALGVDVSNKFISSSGTYENFYVYDGVKYHHIISPITAMPTKTDIVSVTLFGTNGAYLDGYSTVILQLGSECGVEFIDSLADIISEYVIITDEHKIITNIQNIKNLSPSYEIL